MNNLSDQPASVVISTWITGDGKKTYIATVLDANGRAFERREYANPDTCERWVASWALPISGTTWEPVR